MQQIEFNIFYFVEVVKRYWKSLLIINSITIIISIVIAFVLPIQFESKLVFYPYSPEASDPRMMLSENADYEVFSTDDQSTRFILIGESKRIKEYLITKYNLFKRYKIDSTDHMAHYKLAEAIEKNIKLKKGENGAIKLSVFDADRDTAALMANDMAAQISLICNESIKEKNLKIFNAHSSQFNEIEHYVNSLRDSIKTLEIKKGKKFNLKDEVALSNEVAFAMEQYTILKVKYEQAKTIINNELQPILIIEAAQPAYKKSKPQRSYLVGSSFIITFLISLTSFALWDMLSKNKIKA